MPVVRYVTPLFPILLLLSIPQVANAASVTLAAVDADRGIDMFPADGAVDSLFDNDNAITINAPPSDDVLFSSEERGAVEFALAGIPSGAAITAATLRVTLASPVEAVDGAQIHGYSGDGDIDVGDLNVENLVGSFAGPFSSGETVEVAIDAAFIQGLLDSSSGYAGFAVWGVGTPGNASIFTFFGTSFSILNPEDRPPAPELEIEFQQAVPEPGSLLLLAGGLGVLLTRRGHERGFGSRITPSTRKYTEDHG